MLRKQDILQSRYGITFSATGIATGSHGFAVNPDGLDLLQCAETVEAGGSLDGFTKIPVTDSLEVIRNSQANFMFENSPVNHSTGQPAIDHVRAALELGMHVSTANKGTVVHGYRELTTLAESKGRKYYFESTVLGGSPLFSVFRESMPGAEITSFQGILNSTTNIMLSRMERGETFDQAVAYCQSIGVAETDPSADVDGWDAAIKVAALVTVLMGTSFTPQQVERKGIREITPEMIAQAKASGKRWKLVCAAEKVERFGGSQRQAGTGSTVISVVWYGRLNHRRDVPHGRVGRLFDHRVGTRGHGGRPHPNGLRVVRGFCEYGQRRLI